MSIAVAEALVKSGDQDINSIMDFIRDEFMKWRNSPENNRAPGNACLAGVSNMEKGVHWSESGVSDSKGCGSAMRVAPIGYLYQHDPEKLKDVARASGICTHGHRTAVAASIGVAYLVIMAFDGVPPEYMISELLAFTSGISNEFGHAISRVGECLLYNGKANDDQAYHGVVFLCWPLNNKGKKKKSLCVLCDSAVKKGALQALSLVI